MSSSSNHNPAASPPPEDSGTERDAAAAESNLADLERLEKELAEAEASLSYTPTSRTAVPEPSSYVKTTTPPLMMVETAFLASTASLLWLVSYYLSIGPWMRILFPIPIALVFLRWGHRAAWMSAIVSGLLLSVLMGPYLSLLFFVPYGLLGVQLGGMWRRQAPWLSSISIGTLISTFGFFMRMALLSIFLGEDLWNYLTNRITDFIQFVLTKLVDWGLLGLEVLGQTNVTTVQLATVAVVLCSDFIYLFTVHLAAWLLLERLGNPIPDPPTWVQVLMEEEKSA
ncbi:MAG: DUF2232 domain-containing protein [Synechococcales cyanobacterium C42_A2020_086]|jgi:uncharacterized protein YybS (DUF2232 family)|nr:DUF2232 domain-containing protein [Synechococcales cyanobacterium M58_A2018_015]MBF2073821.1 DUF2232 domain-containing protein [Synechococcales cyanobacterium C42_A2020_086]